MRKVIERFPKQGVIAPNAPGCKVKQRRHQSLLCKAGANMEPYLKNWAEALQRGGEESRRIGNLEREAQAINQLNKQREVARRTKPLTEQIEELMRSLPPQLRDRPWSMAELTARLQGKYRDRPHSQQVGEALRKLGGWRRVRLYGRFEGTRLWLPPDVTLPI